jgi:hypothetical protein
MCLDDLSTHAPLITPAVQDTALLFTEAGLREFVKTVYSMSITL